MSSNDAVARGERLRGRIPPAPQGRPLRPRAVARFSGTPRARRTGRSHRRHALRSDRARARRSALRESEERLSLAFAGAQEGVWDWNLETGAVVYSPQWKQMLGYDDGRIEPHVSAWERLLHPDDVERAREVNDSVTTARRPNYEGEFRLRHKNGALRARALARLPGAPRARRAGCPHRRHPLRSDRTKRAEDALRAHDELEARGERTRSCARTNRCGRDGRTERASVPHRAAGRLVFAQEDERRRIAREMHDQFGEQLTALGRGIARLKDGRG